MWDRLLIRLIGPKCPTGACKSRSMHRDVIAENHRLFWLRLQREDY